MHGITWIQPKYHYRLIQLHILSGNKKEASRSIKKYKESIGIDIWLGELYTWFEEYDSAKLCLEQAIQNNDPLVSRPKIKIDLALAYYKTKNWQQAQNIVSELINISKVTKAGSPEYCLGWYYSAIGEVDSAFYWLEKAYKNRSPEMPWLKVTPMFKILTNDDRYWDLYEGAGHKAYDEYREDTEGMIYCT